MNLLQEALTALVAGITYKTGEEIHWHDKYNNPITVECVDAATETYTVRYYYENGQLRYEEQYHQGQLHGTVKVWYENGQLEYEEQYHQGKLIK